MKHVHKFIICISFILIIFCLNGDGSTREKRRLVFAKDTKLFLRLNGKEPVYNWTLLFQHGWGFRINWPMPDTVEKLHKIFRRDVSSHINGFLEQPGSEHLVCILKQYAGMLTNLNYDGYCGVLCKIGQIMNGASGSDVDFFKSVFNGLATYDGYCPSGYEMSPYTDDY